MGTEIGPAEPKLLLPPPSGDHAVGSRAEDLLGRAPLAEAIAAQVAGADPETGVVFGLIAALCPLAVPPAGAVSRRLDLATMTARAGTIVSGSRRL